MSMSSKREPLHVVTYGPDEDVTALPTGFRDASVRYPQYPAEHDLNWEPGYYEPKPGTRINMNTFEPAPRHKRKPGYDRGADTEMGRPQSGTLPFSEAADLWSPNPSGDQGCGPVAFGILGAMVAIAIILGAAIAWAL